MSSLLEAFFFGVIGLFVLGATLVFIDEFFGITARAEAKRSKEDEKRSAMNQKKLTKKFIKEVNVILDENAEKLVSAYRNLVTEDAFGEKNYAKFKSELTKFIYKKSSINKELEEMGLIYEFSENQFNSLIEQIETFLKQEAEEMEYDPDMSPYEYEDFCANEFNKNGWSARSTKNSSDQGIDVIAKRKNKTLVAQCKKYSKPVGNKAVQEVVAGISFYKADVGIVIATNGYTKSAKSLASANNIKLIHHSEIKAL